LDEAKELKDAYSKQVEVFEARVIKRLEDLSLTNEFIKPPVADTLLDIPADITRITDSELGQKHFAAVQWFGYIMSQTALADIKQTLAKEARDGIFSDAMLLSTRSSADDRRCEAERNDTYRIWNMIWMEHFAIFKTLQTL